MDFNNICNQFIYQAKHIDLFDINCLTTLKDKLVQELKIVNDPSKELLEYVLKLIESKIEIHEAQFIKYCEDMEIETNSEHIATWDYTYSTDVYDDIDTGRFDEEPYNSDNY